jgi:xylulokinase
LDKYLLAYDLGTNGVKAALFTPEGQQIVSAYREYGVIFPHPGWVEQSVDSMWAAQCLVTGQLIKQSGCKVQDIAALAISSQRATFAPIDRKGLPIGNFIGWQDTRSIKQCEYIEDKIGARRYYEITGLTISPTAAVSKILWIKENDPELFEKTAVFGTTQCVHLRQLGVLDPPSDLADAGYLGLLDINKLDWSEELLKELEIPVEKLPRLVNSGTIAGKVSDEAAYATGLAAGTPIVVAGGDLQCAGIGLGIVKPGVISLGIGTGGGLLAYSKSPAFHPEMGLNCQPHAMRGGWEVEGICMASGSSFKWYRDILSQMEKQSAQDTSQDPYDFLTASAAKALPGAGGLLFMPMLAGSGAPHCQPKARGVLLGLTLATDKKDINRAVMEGICLELRGMIEAARRSGLKVDEVRIWGGAAKSRFWNQLAADIYGVPAIKMAISEGGLSGAAICAGIGIGLYQDENEGVDHFVKKEERFEPNPKLRSRYDEMYDLYQFIYKVLMDTSAFNRLAALQTQ